MRNFKTKNIAFKTIKCYNRKEYNQNYTENNKTIVINILAFNIFEEGPYHEICKIRREYNKEILTEEIEKL